MKKVSFFTIEKIKNTASAQLLSVKATFPGRMTLYKIKRKMFQVDVGKKVYKTILKAKLLRCLKSYVDAIVHAVWVRERRGLCMFNL